MMLKTNFSPGKNEVREINNTLEIYLPKNIN